MAENRKTTLSHIVEMQNREALTVTAVRDIVSFSENKICLSGDMGLMTILGKELQIKKFSEEETEAHIVGKINSIGYSENYSGASLLSRIFK